MPIYEYKCPKCDTRVLSPKRDNQLTVVCKNCAEFITHQRVFSFTFRPLMHEHYNHTVHKPVSDMKQFAAELRKQSDLATERTGIEHSYVPVEHGDTAALGVTNEGIDEANSIRSARGEPLLPEIK